MWENTFRLSESQKKYIESLREHALSCEGILEMEINTNYTTGYFCKKCLKRFILRENWKKEVEEVL